MTGHEVAVGDFDERGHDDLAGARHEGRAAGMEGAAGGQGSGVGRLTTDDRADTMPIAWVGLRHGGQERLRVGVQGVRHQLA